MNGRRVPFEPSTTIFPFPMCSSYHSLMQMKSIWKTEDGDSIKEKNNNNIRLLLLFFIWFAGEALEWQ